MERQQHINEVIFQSIPINKSLKRWLRFKFLKLVDRNGSVYACAKVKQLREAVIGYRADPKRLEHTEQWLARTGWHPCGWLRMIMRYADTQPEYMLNFLKIYCGPNEPVISVQVAAQDQHKELAKAQSVDSRVPGFFQKWLHHIVREKPLDVVSYTLVQTDMKSASSEDEIGHYCSLAKEFRWARRFILSHEYSVYLEYVRRWKRKLWVNPVSDEEITEYLALYRPTASMYVDYGKGLTDLDKRRSQSLETDLWNFIQMDGYLGLPSSEGGSGLSYESYNFVWDLLDPIFRLSLMDEDQILGFKPDKASISDGTYVGQIHHIPKKGTVGRRSIAAPNRFLQYAMAPADLQLSHTLKALGKGSLGRDCTYDQGHMDAYITNRVSNDALYAGSVDLHHATDYLPFSWMLCIWKELFEGRVPEVVAQSWAVFVDVARGAWLNDGYRDHWSTGQPLGCLPSFRCLGLTHNLLCEALSFVNGYQHSPYCVLGDDVVIMSRRLRKEYIKLMTNAKVPLSLHKSYEHNLVEFAGKMFIRNMYPFYSTDQKALTWNSLYDYQWATGVFVPWENLPRKIRNKICRLCGDCGLPKGSEGKAYSLAYYYASSARGSHIPIGIGPLVELANYCGTMATLLDAEERVTPDLGESCGLQWIGKHPVNYGGYCSTKHHGFYALYRRTEKDWFRDKFRPVATDKLVSAAARAIATAQLCSEH